MTVACRRCGSFFTRAATSNPSISGICASSSTTRNGFPSIRARFIAFRAAAPLAAATGFIRQFVTISSSMRRFVALSSTTRTGKSCSFNGEASGVFSVDGFCKPNRAVKWNVLPRPTWLSTHTRPPINSASCAHIASPRPVPPYFRVVEVSACAKASKILFCFSIGMPIPVSVTEKCNITSVISRFSTPACNTTSPRSVNLIAFPTRFTMIRPSRLGSPTRSSGMSGGKCDTSSRPFSCARTASTFIVSATVSRSSNSTRSNSSLRASTFEKSRMSLIKSSSDAAEVFTVLR